MTRFTPQWLQAGQYAASVDRRLIGALWPAPASSGCAVSAASGMTVNIAAGSVAVPSGNNTGSVLCTSDAVEQVTLAAAPASGTNRWDVIVCQARGNDLDGGTNNDWLFQAVTGTAAATPAVPATPANAVSLAQVYIPGGSASVTAGNITDVRPGWLTYQKAETFAQTLTLTGGSFATAEVWFGTVTVPNLAYPHRVRYWAQMSLSMPAAGNVDFRVRYNTTGAAIAFTDPLARSMVHNCNAGPAAMTLTGWIDRPAGGPSAFGVLALTSGPTASFTTSASGSHLGVWAVPI